MDILCSFTDNIPMAGAGGVIDMGSRLLSGLRKPTVFATSARALENRAFKRGVHAATGCGRDERRFSRESIYVR